MTPLFELGDAAIRPEVTISPEIDVRGPTERGETQADLSRGGPSNRAGETACRCESRVRWRTSSSHHQPRQARDFRVQAVAVRLKAPPSAASGSPFDLC